ncbi:MAG: hypothetical protein LC672_00945, partial [Acidobacteria bacterium]|nr:hypothetical protein [Acidobacteriota bacterium]
MLTPRNKIRLAVAALMPLCLLWVFAACVSSCAEVGGDCRRNEEAQFIGSEHEPESESCAIVDAPTAVLPDRTTNDLPGDHTNADSPSATYMAANNTAPPHVPQAERPKAATGPPFKRLSVI